MKFLGDGHLALIAYGKLAVARYCSGEKRWEELLSAAQDRILEGDYRVVIDYERGEIGDDELFKSKLVRRIENNLSMTYGDLQETLANADPTNPDDGHAIEREIRCYQEAQNEYDAMMQEREEALAAHREALDNDDALAKALLEAEEAQGRAPNEP